MGKRARSPFVAAATSGGVPAVSVDPADVYADDHPLVVAHPEMFVDVDAAVIAAPPKPKRRRQPRQRSSAA
jgi:hypothetical protein